MDWFIIACVFFLGFDIASVFWMLIMRWEEKKRLQFPPIEKRSE
jgi:hypothetical protein